MSSMMKDERRPYLYHTRYASDFKVLNHSAVVSKIVLLIDSFGAWLNETLLGRKLFVRSWRVRPWYHNTID